MTPVTRAERPKGPDARPVGATETRSADFSRSLNSSPEPINSAAFSQFSAQTDRPLAPGAGLLSTGVQFILAQTRTQEAGAPLPPPAKFDRARESYLGVQARIRETIAFNQAFGAENQQNQQVREPSPAAPSTDAPASRLPDAAQLALRQAAYAGTRADDEFDSKEY